MKYVWFVESATSDGCGWSLYSSKSKAYENFWREVEAQNAQTDVVNRKESGSFSVDGLVCEWGKKPVR